MGPGSFRGRQNPDLHGDQLTWPGIDGFPVLGDHRGAVPRNEADYDLVARYGAEEFSMDDPADRKRFVEIMDYVVCGWFKVARRHDRYDVVKGCWVFWLEWVGFYSQITRPQD